MIEFLLFMIVILLFFTHSPLHSFSAYSRRFAAFKRIRLWTHAALFLRGEKVPRELFCTLQLELNSKTLRREILLREGFESVDTEANRGCTVTNACLSDNRIRFFYRIVSLKLLENIMCRFSRLNFHEFCEIFSRRYSE